MRPRISPLLACEASPQPSWAGGPGALPAAQNGGAAARPRGRGRASEPRGAVQGGRRSWGRGGSRPVFRRGGGLGVGTCGGRFRGLLKDGDWPELDPSSEPVSWRGLRAGFVSGLIGVLFRIQKGFFFFFLKVKRMTSVPL